MNLNNLIAVFHNKLKTKDRQAHMLMVAAHKIIIKQALLLEWVLVVEKSRAVIALDEVPPLPVLLVALFSLTPCLYAKTCS